MSKTYFGFALADSMFAECGNCVISRRVLTVEEVKGLESSLTPCLNPSHEATIQAMRSRFGINVSIPNTPPRVALHRGDGVVVMGVRGLPRLTDRHEYAESEIAAADFAFTLYRVE